MDRHETDRPRVDQRRLVAALHLRGVTLADICRRAGRTQRHLQFILTGKRDLTEPLLSAIREAAGPEGWDFATGKAQALLAPTETTRAA